MMHWGEYGYGWGMGFGPFFMIIFVALVIVCCLLVFRFITGAQRPKGSDESAIDILKKRYAKGELSKEEFEEMKKNIQ
jgi:putative membrane protein